MRSELRGEELVPAGLHFEDRDLRRKVPPEDAEAVRAGLDHHRERRDAPHLAVHPDRIPAPRLEARVAQERAPDRDTARIRGLARVSDQLRAAALEHLHLQRARALSGRAETAETR